MNKLSANTIKSTHFEVNGEKVWGPMIRYLNVELQILTNSTEIQDPLDWTVGKHGIEIKYTSPEGETYSVGLLPNEIESYGWDQKDLIN